MNQPVITTTRLTLRDFTIDDAADVQALAGNYNVSKTTLRIPYPYEDGMAEEWIRSLSLLRDQESELAYAVTLSEPSQLIGAIGLHALEGSSAELGYWIGEPYWGNGYCSEAAQALVEFAFDRLRLDCIRAEHLVTNPASGQVMQNIGMRYVGETVKRDRYDRNARMALYETRKT